MDATQRVEKDAGKETGACEERKNPKEREWKKPVLEDVSGKVMAQPYIRFT